MAERMLITKLVRTEQTRADLYARGHQWPDLKLFDLSDLIEVGLDLAWNDWIHDHPRLPEIELDLETLSRYRQGLDEGVTITFYADSDGDGYGNAEISLEACIPPRPLKVRAHCTRGIEVQRSPILFRCRVGRKIGI